MSIVGPRPLSVPESPDIPKQAFSRYSVPPPGLTGLAQIANRGAMINPERFDGDQEYIRNPSFSKDLEIIIKTLPRIKQD